MADTEKICCCCGEKKDLSLFAKRSRNKTGYDSVCKKCKNEKLKKYRKDNPEKVKKWGRDNSKTQRQKNQKKCQESKTNSYNKKRDYYNKKWKEYAKYRYDNDLNYRLRSSLRSRLYLAIKNNSKSASTLELLGCDIDFLREYIEERFNGNMSWENYGEWHIDHIKPCASFDLSKPEQQKQCFHYTNLQPLWAIDNIRKSDKYDE